MVSGSDQHGTPITVRAAGGGQSRRRRWPRASTRSSSIRGEQLGIGFDLYTTTGTDEPRRASRRTSSCACYEKGDIYLDKMRLPYCTVEQPLPARPLRRGHLPHLRLRRRPRRPVRQLRQPARPGGADRRPLQVRRLDAGGAGVGALLPPPERLQRHAQGVALRRTRSTGGATCSTSRSGAVKQGLRDRAITRDIDWGIAIPLPGYEQKRIYVWFEAVIGYLSAAKEWAQLRGDAGGLARVLARPGVQELLLHRQGQHLVPHAELAGDAHGLRRPEPALRRSGEPVPELRRRQGFDEPRHGALPARLPRALRPGHAALLPRGDHAGDARTASSAKRTCIRRNNDELVATWGNLAHRVLTFTYRRFDGRVPAAGRARRGEPGAAGAGGGRAGRGRRATSRSATSGRASRRRWPSRRRRTAISTTRRPGRRSREDPQAAAMSLYTALAAINALKVALYPYLPFTCERLHGYLGFDGEVAVGGWQATLPPPGQAAAGAGGAVQEAGASAGDEAEAANDIDVRLPLPPPDAGLRDGPAGRAGAGARQGAARAIVVIGMDVPSSRAGDRPGRPPRGCSTRPSACTRTTPSCLDAEALRRLRELAREPRVVAHRRDRPRLLSQPVAAGGAAEGVSRSSWRWRRSWTCRSSSMRGRRRRRPSPILRDWATARGRSPRRAPLGVLHCFAGDLAMAQEYVELGFMISIAGNVTYPERRAAAGGRGAALPLEHLLVGDRLPVPAAAEPSRRALRAVASARDHRVHRGAEEVSVDEVADADGGERPTALPS